jgi:spore coat protein CotH
VLNSDYNDKTVLNSNYNDKKVFYTVMNVETQTLNNISVRNKQPHKQNKTKQTTNTDEIVTTCKFILINLRL